MRLKLFGLVLVLAASVVAWAGIWQGSYEALDCSFTRRGKSFAPPRDFLFRPYRAHWIWSQKSAGHQTVYLRKVFSLDKPPASARLYCTADNYFTAYVNGVRVLHTDSSVGGGGWRLVRVAEVGKLLHPGKNSLAIIGVNAGGVAGVIGALSGKNLLVATDATWKVSDAPATGWEKPAFDDSTWEKVRVLGGEDALPWNGMFGPWPYPLHAAYLRDKPCKARAIAAQSKGVVAADDLLSPKGTATFEVPAEGEAPWVLVDFGREIYGQLRVQSASKVPIKVLVSVGESASEAMHQPYYGEEPLEIAPGGSELSLETAFRYAKVTCVAPPGQKVKLKQVSANFIYYPVVYQGDFESSDDLLNRLWWSGAYTVHLCMQTDIYDAPKRDRLRWMGDLYVMEAALNDVFADHFLLRQTMDRLRLWGGPPHAYIDGVPSYTLFWVLAQKDYYMHFGDLDYLKAQHGLLISLLDFFKDDLDERGIFANKRHGWNFIDWGDLTKDEENAAVHLQLCLALKAGAWMLEQMGDAASARRYRLWARQATAAARTYLLDPQTNTYGDNLQVNVMAVYSGVATADQRKAILKRFLLADQRQPITPFYNYFVLEDLASEGRYSAALAFIRRYWGSMLEHGATTLWEKWSPDTDFYVDSLDLPDPKVWQSRLSLSHGWSAGPTAWLQEHVVGLTPEAPGFTVVKIAPHLCDLKQASAAVPTPYGKVKASWRRTAKGLAGEIVLPAGCTGDLYLPVDSHGYRLTCGKLSFEPAKKTPGAQVQYLLPGGATYVVEPL